MHPFENEYHTPLEGKTAIIIVSERNAPVRLRHKTGTARDVENAALFLNWGEEDFVNGVWLPVDGGNTLKVGRRGVTGRRAAAITANGRQQKQPASSRRS